MSVVVTEAHSKVQQANEKIALKYGPVAYCVEGADNKHNIFNILMSPDTKFTVEDKDVSGLMLPVIGFNAKLKNNNSDELYFSE